MVCCAGKLLHSIQPVLFAAVLCGMLAPLRANATQLNDSDPVSGLGPGTRFTLNEQLVLPVGDDTPWYFQNGIKMKYTDVDKAEPYCRIYVKNPDVAHTVPKGKILVVTRVRPTGPMGEPKTWYYSLEFGTERAVGQLQCYSRRGDLLIGDLKTALGPMMDINEVAPPST
jgi:hypothetical protein